MVLGIVSLLSLIGGIALVIVLGVALFYFLRAILNPFSSGERGGRGRPPSDRPSERSDEGGPGPGEARP
jgi:hypothetical protein